MVLTRLPRLPADSSEVRDEGGFGMGTLMACAAELLENTELFSDLASEFS